MGPITVRCSFCGTRASVLLNESQRRALHANNEMARVCSNCGGTTRWEPVFSSGSMLPDVEQQVSGPRVLLIDDDESILAVLRKALSGFKWDVETASSARDAAMSLTRTDYDVIVSDIRMPGFDGKQLFEFLDKHLPEYKRRVIFLTGDTGTPSTMEFLQRTRAPYLTKPVDLPALVELVTKAKAAGSF